MAEDKGHETDSPLVETEPGQEQKTETPPVETTTDDIIKAASEMEESAASETDKKKEDTEEKSAPYDQDPKWLAARAAEKSLQEILEDNDVEDVEGLKVMLKSGMTLSEILGDRDAKQLVQDADTLKKYQEHWAEQDRLKAEEDLDPDERANKYKKELEDHRRQQSDKEGETKKIEDAKAAITGFNDRVGGIVDKQGFDEGTAEIAKMFLGVNNPFNDVDILDPKAVRSMVDTGVEKLNKFLADVRQKAVDEYAAGKSEITPITTTETPDKTDAIKKKEISKDASVDEVFAAARDELLEVITGGASP